MTVVKSNQTRQRTATPKSQSARTPRRRLRSMQRADSSAPQTIAPVAFAQQQNFRKATSYRTQNSEFIGNISGSSTFQIQSTLILNPGFTATFPWLSAMAKQWQQYHFHRLQFRYITRCPTSIPGSVVLYPEYNPNEPAPTSEAAATNNQDSVEDVVWRTVVCKLTVPSMFPLGPKKFVRFSNVASSDLSTYDAGKLYVTTSDCSGVVPIGKLWVDYDVEFFVPQTQLSISYAPSTVSVFYYSAFSGMLVPNIGTNTAVQFDTAEFDPLGIGLPTGLTVFNPPAGSYLVSFQGLLTVANGNEQVWGVELTQNGTALPALLGSWGFTTNAAGITALIVTCNVQSVIVNPSNNVYSVLVAGDTTTGSTTFTLTAFSMIWRSV